MLAGHLIYYSHCWSVPKGDRYYQYNVYLHELTYPSTDFLQKATKLDLHEMSKQLAEHFADDVHNLLKGQRLDILDGNTLDEVETVS